MAEVEERAMNGRNDEMSVVQIEKVRFSVSEFQVSCSTFQVMRKLKTSNLKHETCHSES